MKAVTEEDESYAKATTGPPIDDEGSINNNIVKVLGSIWNTACNQSVHVQSVRSFQSSEVASDHKTIVVENLS